PFMIFSDASLKDMTRIMPLDEETFLEVSGVGQVKLKKYGHVFLEALNIYNQE
ncbi:MAG: HRDC domain-containing protein, partial [Lactococcus garvieae]